MIKTQSQFIRVDFDFIDSECFQELSPSALKEYLVLRRFVQRSPNYEYYQKGYLATTVSIETLSKLTHLGKNTITNNHREMDLEKNDKGIIKIENTGRGLVFILGEVKKIKDSNSNWHTVEIYYYDATIQTEKEFERESVEEEIGNESF